MKLTWLDTAYDFWKAWRNMPAIVFDGDWHDVPIILPHRINGQFVCFCIAEQAWCDPIYSVTTGSLEKGGHYLYRLKETT